jgi:Cu+-exporting ATPase
MAEEKQMTLPVLGMTCANCVASVERNAKKAGGVNDAVVNFASEKVLLTYDPAVTQPQEVIDRIHRAGYEVPITTIDLPIVGMTCANCVATVERALNKVDGVLEVTVNYASEKATVRYVVGTTGRASLVAAVRKAGYDVVEAEGDDELEDAEAAARQAEIRHQEKRSGIAGRMVARDMGELAFLRSGHAGPILRGLGLLRGSLQEPAQSQRQYGRAGSHGLVSGLFL